MKRNEYLLQDLHTGISKRWIKVMFVLTLN